MSDRLSGAEISDRTNQEDLFPEGLSVERIRALLAERHDISVPKDDPLLMMVTIQNAFLREQAALQKKHEKALAAFMNAQTETFTKDMNASVAELTKTLSGMTIDGIKKSVADFSAALASSRSTLLLCTAINALSVLLIVGVFVLKGAL